MKLLAHLTLCDGVKIEQSLEKHCLKAAEYASRTLADSNLYYTGYLAGILHDMGKAKHSFNCYLEKAFAGEKVIPGSVNHTFAGVIWLFEKYHTKSASVFERLTCEVIGYAIGAHHGMFDCVNLDGKNGFEHRLKKEKAEIHYEEAVENCLDQVISEGELDECFQKAVSEIQTFFENARKQYDGKFEEVCFQVSMLTRLILSSVIYGDRRDTREFMTQHEDHGEDDVCWKIRKEYFENKIGSFDTVSRLNQVRSDISRQCLEFAQKPSGIYRLNVPTGAGKTLCTLRYALTHAEKYKKKRIIFVIPLLSVLEQNAKVLREYIGDEEIILEHHSNVIQENMQNEELDRYELLCTTWDAPVIITTLVQLLNTLFAGQTSAVGRMRALCDSIIVIDEVQSLPKKTTEMFNMAMNFLYHYCNAAIILSSATQPCFEELKWPVHLADHPDMVKLNENQMNVFDRSEIIDCTDPYGMDFDEWADFCKERMEHHHSLLVICNTKTEARTLFEEIQKDPESQKWDIFHLSTSMCQSHRMEVIDELRTKLSILQDNVKNDRECRKLICISTQLVEAGVDFSFEGVVRVLAGIDNLAQAAGRCNRSNEYKNKGNVYLVNLKDENLRMLHEIENAQKSTGKVLARRGKTDGGSLIGVAAAHEFYKYMFEATAAETRYPIKDYGKTIYLADLLANKNSSADTEENESYFMRQPFAAVGRAFKVFDENTTDVLVPYKEGKNLIEKLQHMDGYASELSRLQNIMKEAKQYTIRIYQWQKEKLDKEGLLFSLCNGRVSALDERVYSDQIGLTGIKEPAVESFIL